MNYRFIAALLLVLSLALGASVSAQAAAKKTHASPATQKKAASSAKSAKPTQSAKSSRSGTAQRSAKKSSGNQTTAAGHSVSASKAKSRSGQADHQASGSSRKVARKSGATARPSVVKRDPVEDMLLTETGNLAVQSSSALVFDAKTGSTLFSKNAGAVLPIASITKLMTAMVVLDAYPNLTEDITISDDDIDYLRGSRSRLPAGTSLSREHALLLALMSSENRAASALSRHYAGGKPAFVAAMNRKAADLGMTSTHFDDPTGLSNTNVSTAEDLGRMVAAANKYPLIRELSTTSGATVELGEQKMEFHNTNALIKNPDWEIYLSKTGFIHEAGKCLVMQARVADKPVTIVLLDAAGKATRISDANRIKRWMELSRTNARIDSAQLALGH